MSQSLLLITGVYKERWLNLQLNLYPALTDEESMEQLAQFI